jgi:hypothetical protein
MKTNNITGDLLIADVNPRVIKLRGRTFVVAGILAPLFGVFNLLLFFGFCYARGTPAIVAGATMVAVSCVEAGHHYPDDSARHPAERAAQQCILTSTIN